MASTSQEDFASSGENLESESSQKVVDQSSASTGSSPDKPKSKKKLYIWLGVVAVLVVAVVGVWNFASTNYFCSKLCHSMLPTYEGWVASEHRSVSCIDCHAGQGFVEEFKAHMAGVKELYIMVTENPSAAEVYATPDIVPADRCLRCHDKDWDELPADHPAKDSYCAVCHRESFHPNEKPLFIPVADQGGE